MHIKHFVLQVIATPAPNILDKPNKQKWITSYFWYCHCYHRQTLLNPKFYNLLLKLMTFTDEFKNRECKYRGIHYDHKIAEHKDSLSVSQFL